ncbi:hypothetical protein WJX72_002370 [[Myrmecia] bisecta]|uniref:Protein kinase domain-containing protein n=1 Tax=[Myrmecia] bisecta TaxID=41462 RepID=A0AAW1QPM2_9CHLO
MRLHQVWQAVFILTCASTPPLHSRELQTAERFRPLSEAGPHTRQLQQAGSPPSFTGCGGCVADDTARAKDCTCVHPLTLQLALHLSPAEFAAKADVFATTIRSVLGLQDASQVQVVAVGAGQDEPASCEVTFQLLPWTDSAWSGYMQGLLASRFRSHNVAIGRELGGAYTYVCLDTRAQFAAKNLWIIILAAAGAGVLLLSAMCAFCCYRRRKAGRAHVITAATHPPGQFMTSTDRLRTGAARNANSSVTELLLPHCHRFTYAELAAATGGFAEGNVLGEGGFGRVYKGVLRDGKSVAVKRLDRGGLQGDKEFNVEISTLAALRHANLVTLLGICTEGDHRLAAFEFAQHGSLRSALDVSTPGSAAAAGGGRSRQGPLRWQQRLEIALGAARGLAYMHEVAKPAIIHRDFKSTNILVDAAGQARICDFGLARRLHGLPSARSGGSLRHGESSGGALNTMVMGTFGYVAPEYAATGHLSEKSDVYSFGVVLLELLTGLNPVDVSRQPGRQSLVEWLMPALHDLTVLQRHLDPHLGSVESQVPQLAALAEVASACLQLDPARRPRMGEGAVDTSMHDLVITASTSTMDDYTIAVAERRTMYTPGFDDAFASTTPERSPFDAPSVSTASPAGAVEEYTQAAPGRGCLAGLQSTGVFTAPTMLKPLL